MLSLCEWQVQSNKGSVLQNNEGNDMRTFYDLTGIIVWDYDKGRSECPERWNDPLDYEEDCEDHYLLTRGVEVDDDVWLFGKHMSFIEDVFEPPTQWQGHLLGKIKKADLQRFFDKKSVMWTPSWYEHLLDRYHFRDKEVRLSVWTGTADEFYDTMTREY